MTEKNTFELEKTLRNTHIDDFEDYCTENKDCMIDKTGDFQSYIRQLLLEKGISQQNLFLRADIPERYGYKLLSGEKHTKRRDVLLRLCYAGEFSLSETQRILKKYPMPQLYAKIPRDALLMILFRERPGDIYDINELLRQKGFEPLQSIGAESPAHAAD